MQTQTIQSHKADIFAFGQAIIDGKIQPTDDNETFACLDSLSSLNQSTRKFFFEVYRVIAQKADGALAEVVGAYLQFYFKAFPQEALYNFKRLDKAEQTLFINNLAYEFYFSENDYKTEIDSYFDSIYKICKECKTDDKLLEFIKNRIVETVAEMNE